MAPRRGDREASQQRWVAYIRRKLMADTHRRLAERLRVSEQEMGSIYKMVKSQIDVSLSQRLRR